MMMTAQEFLNLKERVESLRRDRDRARGTLDQLYRDLRKGFGCRDLKDAKAALRELEANLQQDEKSYNKALNKFEDQYANISP